jgi:hypothetical protein
MFIVYILADTSEQALWSIESQNKKSWATTRLVGNEAGATDTFNTRHLKTIIHAVINHEAGAPSSAALQIGKSGDRDKIPEFKGAIAECLYYEKALTYKEVRKIQTYLAIKYGITIQGNYLGTHDQVLWDQKRNERFNHHIFGIAADSTWHLLQKQAESAEDSTHFISIFTGSPFPTNNENPAELSEGVNILIGDNNEAAKWQDPVDSAAALQILKRQWSMQTSGIGISDLSTELHVAVGQIPVKVPGQFVLLLGKVGETNWKQPGSFQILYPKSLLNGVAIFKDIDWTSNTQERIFTIGYLKTQKADIDSKVTAEPSFRVLPNLMGHDEAFTVQVRQPGQEKAFIKIRDVRGQVVAQKEINGSGNFTFSGLPTSGTYFVTVEIPAIEVLPAQKIIVK